MANSVVMGNFAASHDLGQHADAAGIFVNVHAKAAALPLGLGETVNSNNFCILLTSSPQSRLYQEWCDVLTCCVGRGTGLGKSSRLA